MRAIVNVRVPRASDGRFLNDRQLRNILQGMGLEPSDIPSYPAASDNQDTPDPTIEGQIQQYSLNRAEPIIFRMPERSDEETQRKEFAKKTIFYAGTLSNSNTLFMVNRESNGTARFRLLNSKIEDLQEGCDDLIRIIEHHNRSLIERFLHVFARSDSSFLSLGIEEKIKIYEHGLEESTISGVVIKGFRRRWRYILRHSGLEVTVFFVGAILFGMSFVLLNSDVIRSESSLTGHIERFSTAMITTAIVSLISVFNAFRLMPVVQWTASYEE
jgi:hypothetical protein